MRWPARSELKCEENIPNLGSNAVNGLPLEPNTSKESLSKPRQDLATSVSELYTADCN